MNQLAEATVVFRVDASLRIGTGHVARCLTLAQALAARGARCRFVARAHPGHLLERVQALGFEALALPPPGTGLVPPGDWLGASTDDDARQTLAVLGGTRTDWIVVDHYALDAAWERAMQPACVRLLAIDDLADRAHAVQCLLDQNLGRVSTDYAAWVEPGCRVLAGPTYALLRPQFAAARAASLARRRARPPLRELLIALGGVDADNHTTAVLSALAALGAQALPAEARIRVVMGPTAPALAAVRVQAAAMPWLTSVQVGVDDMAALMHEADLAIGAAGVSAWERCCLGLPTLLLLLADNQRLGAAALQAAGAARLVGADMSVSHLCSALLAALQALHDGEARAAMAEAAAAVTDGQGAERVADILEAAHA